MGLAQLFVLLTQVAKRRPTPVLASGMAFFGSCSATEHNQAELGVLVMPKLPVGAVLEFAFAIKSRFCHRELLCLWF
jgi:hypothetical protein